MCQIWTKNPIRAPALSRHMVSSIPYPPWDHLRVGERTGKASSASPSFGSWLFTFTSSLAPRAGGCAGIYGRLAAQKACVPTRGIDVDALGGPEKIKYAAFCRAACHFRPHLLSHREPVNQRPALRQRAAGKERMA